MLTFLNCKLSNFQRDLPDVAIRNSIRTEEIFQNFTDFCVPDITKTNKVINLI